MFATVQQLRTRSNAEGLVRILKGRQQSYLSSGFSQKVSEPMRFDLDRECREMGGTCIDTTTQQCNNKVHEGKCMSPINIQCCVGVASSIQKESPESQGPIPTSVSKPGVNTPTPAQQVFVPSSLYYCSKNVCNEARVSDAILTSCFTNKNLCFVTQQECNVECR